MREEYHLMEDKLNEADPDGLFLFALEPYPYMMTPDQISDFTGLSSQGVRKLLSKGDMKGCQVGNRWLVPKLALVRYLNSGCTQTHEDTEAADGTTEMR